MNGIWFDNNFKYLRPLRFARRTQLDRGESAWKIRWKSICLLHDASLNASSDLASEEGMTRKKIERIVRDKRTWICLLRSLCAGATGKTRKQRRVWMTVPKKLAVTVNASKSLNGLNTVMYVVLFDVQIKFVVRQAAQLQTHVAMQSDFILIFRQ